MSYFELLPYDLKKELLLYFSIPQLTALLFYLSQPFSGLASLNNDWKFWASVISRKQKLPLSALTDYTVDELKLLLEFPLNLSTDYGLQNALTSAISTNHKSMSLYLLNTYSIYQFGSDFIKVRNQIILPFYKLAANYGQFEVLEAFDQHGFEFAKLTPSDKKNLTRKAARSDNLETFLYIYNKLPEKIRNDVEFNRELIDEFTNKLAIIKYYLDNDVADVDWATYILQVGWTNDKILNLLYNYRNKIDKSEINYIYEKVIRIGNTKAAENIKKLLS